MKIIFLLLIISNAFDANAFDRNASENATESKAKIANETLTKNTTLIECQFCPNRQPPAITKWLQDQAANQAANQAAEISKACFGFLFIVIF